MAKLTRATQRVFGSSAGADQIAQFGSLAAVAPTFTTNPETIQALSNYLTGWFGAVIGANSPAIEDMNALCFLFAYQLAYLMQAGTAEWDDGTTYYIGSIANDGNGNLYVSIANDNTNNALTDTTKWQAQSGAVFSINPATTPTLALSTFYNRAFVNVNSANGACTVTLPAASGAYRVVVKDVGGAVSGVYPITIGRNGASIEGVASNYSCEADYGMWTFVCDGTNWFIEA